MCNTEKATESKKGATGIKLIRQEKRIEWFFRSIELYSWFKVIETREHTCSVSDSGSLNVLEGELSAVTNPASKKGFPKTSWHMRHLDLLAFLTRSCLAATTASGLG